MKKNSGILNYAINSITLSLFSGLIAGVVAEEEKHEHLVLCILIGIFAACSTAGALAGFYRNEHGPRPLMHLFRECKNTDIPTSRVLDQPAM